jgi:hypothetical protein
MGKRLEKTLDFVYENAQPIFWGGFLAGIVTVAGLAIKNNNDYIAENTFTDTVKVENILFNIDKNDLGTYVKIFSDDGKTVKHDCSKDIVENLTFTIKKGGDVEVTGYPARNGDYTIATDLRPLKPVEPVNYASK